MTLIDRLSKLEGPDWEVSCEIISSLISVDDPDAKDFYGSGQNYTASVDAAIALAERVLPGWIWLKPNFGTMMMWRPADGDTEAVEYSGYGKDAIALCIAIMRAKEASNG